MTLDFGLQFGPSLHPVLYSPCLSLSLLTFPVVIEKHATKEKFGKNEFAIRRQSFPVITGHFKPTFSPAQLSVHLTLIVSNKPWEKKAPVIKMLTRILCFAVLLFPFLSLVLCSSHSG